MGNLHRIIHLGKVVFGDLGNWQIISEMRLFKGLWEFNWNIGWEKKSFSWKLIFTLSWFKTQEKTQEIMNLVLNWKSSNLENFMFFIQIDYGKTDNSETTHTFLLPVPNDPAYGLSSKMRRQKEKSTRQIKKKHSNY